MKGWRELRNPAPMTKEKTRMVVTDPQCNACAAQRTHSALPIRKTKDAREKKKRKKGQEPISWVVR